MKTPPRKTTSYSFNVGYVLITASVFLVVAGLFKGIVTATNLSDILWSLLIPACSFFGLTVFRAGAAELVGMRTANPASVNVPVQSIPVTNPIDTAISEQSSPLIDYNFTK